MLIEKAQYCMYKPKQQSTQKKSYTLYHFTYRINKRNSQLDTIFLNIIDHYVHSCRIVV